MTGRLLSAGLEVCAARGRRVRWKHAKEQEAMPTRGKEPAGRLPPHPATVVQAKTVVLPVPTPRTPHLATVAQAKPPHPATVMQPRMAPGRTFAPSPHAATAGRRRVAQASEASESDEAVPTTVNWREMLSRPIPLTECSYEYDEVCGDDFYPQKLSDVLVVARGCKATKSNDAAFNCISWAYSRGPDSEPEPPSCWDPRDRASRSSSPSSR